MTARHFAVTHARAMLLELSRYARAGIVVEELIRDVELATETFWIRAVEIGGGDA